MPSPVPAAATPLTALARALANGARRLPALRPPSLCAVCHGWGRQRVCALCLDRFAAPVPRCRRCALRVPGGQARCGACLTEPPPFASTWAAVDYDHPWDSLISSFKFHAGLDLAPTLVELLLRAREHAGGPTPAVLLPIPLSAERLRERGYNQAWELARRAGRALGVPAEPRWLLRVRDTAHQLAFAPGQRAGNVRRAFAVDPDRLADVRGTSVVLVDDVMTSGATLAEAARTLRAAGATEVGAWVVARTPRAAEA